MNELNSDALKAAAALTQYVSKWHVEKIIRTYLDALPKQEPSNETESEPVCKEADGCPTEKAVLMRFWRQHQRLSDSGWMPIESAPKDDRRILLSENGSVYIGSRRVGYDYWDWEGEECGGHGKPNHWQPLPDPPKGD